MKSLKYNYLKYILIWMFNCLVLIIPSVKPAYYMYINNMNVVLPIRNDAITNMVLRSILIFIVLFLINFLSFKIAKYISYKIRGGKVKYLTIFFIFYIELFILTLLFLKNFKLAFLGSFFIIIYSFIVMLQDYLFSKIYKRFNTLRVMIINTIVFLSITIGIPVFIIITKFH